MRILLLVFWMLLPVGALAFHLGPGQNHVRLDEASQLLAVADMHANDKKWDQAQDCYEAALNLLPEHRKNQASRIRLEIAKVQMNNAQLPVAHKDLQGLVQELKSDADSDPKLLSEARSTLANSRYYMTWLMRLEGLPRADWEPEIEAAQQTYRLLAKQAEQSEDDESFVIHTEDLESSVRLARMDLGQLQGLPLPSQ